MPLAPDARRPWRLSSQVYVAFFGGVLAVTVIALTNAPRLRTPVSRQAVIAGIGAIGLACVIVFAVLSSLPRERGSSSSSSRWPPGG
ncbi:MAG: OST3/OST6 family protein [Actinomycetota bacterium]|nr:OST3/OST6 family protein [Actinomycetota bacterium]MDQ3720304.1 OST3/OST6 family protein [Actinomycetota bacterium]